MQKVMWGSGALVPFRIVGGNVAIVIGQILAVDIIVTFCLDNTRRIGIRRS